MNELEKDLFDLFRAMIIADKYCFELKIISREMLNVYMLTPIGLAICDLIPENEVCHSLMGYDSINLRFMFKDCSYIRESE